MRTQVCQWTRTKPRWTWLLPAVVGTIVLPGTVRADNALVVGVNEYPSLTGANLHGCVDDAQAMTKALERQGFKVTTLTDARATRGSILDALDAMAATNKDTERFAFYFAGHGTRALDGKSSSLLPSDAVEDNEQHDISTADLYDKFKGIPASSRTVFLDSCFSGGMMRAISLGAKRHPFRMSRYFNRAGRVHPSVVIDVPVNEQDGSKDLMRVSKVSNPNNPNSGNADESIGPVCYFTATQGNEQAGEDEFNGQRHGVFTYYLTGVMDQIKERDAARMTWEELDTKVGAAVAKWMDDTQHPVVSHWYLDKGLFEGPHKPPPPPPPPSPSPVKHSVWDEYNTDHPDASRVTVAMKPDQTSVRVNVDKLHIVATARASGFLVILERGTSGSINLLFPNTRDASAARVNEDKVVDIPDKDSDFTPDSPGTERIKAILFSEERYCKELLEKFNADLKIPNITDASSTRDLSRVPHQSFYTSDIEFEAVTPDAGQNP